MLCSNGAETTESTELKFYFDPYACLNLPKSEGM